ncbi:DNL zinc finger-domain-containing protein [Dunaliella salina]|uniref:DNL zinc finger-domain-containing protein n=1 Tax=Dunaliella salina TaxID=3046 RepID=A0ABQ7G1L2_DUNSA|nr:DNL zinc finger-domain-containing protein [Dunaliella salina]|eukprot:KAF5828497.1 DNL zinc finger-domain-containing protein [Dunaliella salina]
MRRPGQALYLLHLLQRHAQTLRPFSVPSTHGPILHLALKCCSQEQLGLANTCGLRGLAASCAPCSNQGGNDSVQGPPSSSSQGSSSQPSAAGEFGRVQPTLAMMYTCGKCGTRSMKTFSHQAFKHGVVLIRCPSCRSLHLIADNLGWFGERGWTVERLMAQAQGLGSATGQASAPHSPESRGSSDADVTGTHDGYSEGPSSMASSSAPGASNEGGSCPCSSAHGGGTSSEGGSYPPSSALSSGTSNESGSSSPPAGQGMITDADMEGYHKVQQLFEVAMRSQGAGGQHYGFQPEELSVMEVSEEDFKAWAAVMKRSLQDCVVPVFP